MLARCTLALALGCAALVARPDPVRVAAANQPPAPPPRVHVDPGHHVGPVDYLCFRDDDKQLVSVGRDRTARVWDVDPKNGRPRGLKTFFFPDVPSAAALNPNGGGRYLACGYCRRDGKDFPTVRVVDLSAAADGRADHIEAEIRDPGLDPRVGLVAVGGVCFDHLGRHLMVTGGSGRLWHWHEPDWAVKAGKPREVVVPPMKGYAMNAVAFSSDGLFLAAGGWDPSNKAEQHVCVIGFAGGKLDPLGWRKLPLPGTNPFVYAMDWNVEFGLAVAYYTEEPGRLARARVAVFPTDKVSGVEGKARDVALGVGATQRVAWTRDGTILATVVEDAFDTQLPPEFLRLDGDKLVRVPRDAVFPGLDEHEVRKAQKSGLNGCAVGRGKNPLSLAWAGCAHGTIELARIKPGAGGKNVGELVSLDKGGAPRENWFTRLGWDDATGKLVLMAPGGRELARDDPGLWGVAGLPAANQGGATKVEHNPAPTSATPNPVACRADLPDGATVGCDSTWLVVTPKGKGEKLLTMFPGVRSLLTFKRSNLVVALRPDGEITFWDYRPARPGGKPTLTPKATATLNNGQLAYTGPNNARGGWDTREFIPVRNLEQTVVRVYPKPGAGEPQPASIVGLELGVVLPAGAHAFRVQVPHTGTLSVEVEGDTGVKRWLLKEKQVTEREVTQGVVTLPVGQLLAGDRQLSVTLLPPDGTQGHTTYRSIQVAAPGRVILFDVTPQVGRLQEEARGLEGLCTEWPQPKPDSPDRYCPTADALAKILRALGRRVERHSAATRSGGTHTATAAAADYRITRLADGGGIRSDDCFILLLKGHGQVYPDGDGRDRAIFKTDDFDRKAAERGYATGLTSDHLAELLKRVSRHTDKVVVVLDCCHAENFLNVLHAGAVSFYPCSLRGQSADAVILPEALNRVLARVQAPEFRAGLVTQGDLLQLIDKECRDGVRELFKKDRGEEPWGAPVLRHTFILANKTR